MNDDARVRPSPLVCHPSCHPSCHPWQAITLTAAAAAAAIGAVEAAGAAFHAAVASGDEEGAAKASMEADDQRLQVRVCRTTDAVFFFSASNPRRPNSPKRWMGPQPNVSHDANVSSLCLAGSGLHTPVPTAGQRRRVEHRRRCRRQLGRRPLDSRAGGAWRTNDADRTHVSFHSKRSASLLFSRFGSGRQRVADVSWGDKP